MRGLGMITIMTAAGAVLLGAVPAAASGRPAVAPDQPATASGQPATASGRPVAASGRPVAASGWAVVPSPPSGGGFFNAVSARTDADAWAVGDLSASTPLTARWNGTSWTQVTGPTIPGAANTVLNAVSASAGSDAWAVGRTTQSLVTSSLAIHWTGKPNPARGLLLSVTGTRPRNVTAAGHNTTPNGPTAAIILHWNGSAWTKVTLPKVGATDELNSASAAHGGTLTWAFGRSTSSGGVVSNLTLRNG